MKLSTPSIDGFGINKYFETSTQEHWFFPCPHCGKMIQLKFPDNIVITANSLVDPRIEDTHIICHLCKEKLSHEQKPKYLTRGEWVPKFKDRSTRGFHVNQLYSATVKPAELAKASIKAETDPTEEQEFFNSKLGEPHVVKGARVTDAMIDECTGQHKQGTRSTNFITMGVDVGTWLHVEIDEWKFIGNAGNGINDINLLSKPRLICQKRVAEFEELDLLMREFRVLFCVIDANPERRKAREFCRRFNGYARMCFYGNDVSGKEIHEKAEEYSVTVDRTSWLDLALGRLKNKGIILPVDTDHEYKEHVKAPVRVYKKDSNGNPVAKYVEGSSADHYAHSRNYSEIALQFAARVAEAKDIGVRL